MCTECYRLAADKARYRIMDLLQQREMSVSELTDLLHVRQPTVTHHLRLLSDSGLVKVRRQGRERRYSLNGESECFTECGLLAGLGRKSDKDVYS